MLPDLSLLGRDVIETLLIEKHQQMVAQHEGLASRDSEIEHLKIVIAKLRRMMLGTKSERLRLATNFGPLAAVKFGPSVAA